VAFGVVPAATPELCDDPPPELVPASALTGGVITAADGVYFTDVLKAFEPAAAEADDENDVVAPAPLAPEDAFD
jgi:hypothetical protein